MSDTVTCESCRGVGKILQLGNYKDKCKPCLGLGFVVKKGSGADMAPAIEVNDACITTQEDNVPRETITAPSQRGRKKKVV